MKNALKILAVLIPGITISITYANETLVAVEPITTRVVCGDTAAQNAHAQDIETQLHKSGVYNENNSLILFQPMRDARNNRNDCSLFQAFEILKRKSK